MPRSTKHPAYRLYRRTGQAVVTLNGRDHYLGKHGTKVSRNTYDRLVGEWLSGGRTLPADESGSQLTVTELLAAYLRWAKQYHPPKEIAHIKIVSRALKEIYGRTSVRDFGPLALKVVRQRFVDQGRVRGSINDDVARIRRIFKCGTENELLPASVLHALQAVSGLRRGRTEAPEGKGSSRFPRNMST